LTFIIANHRKGGHIGRWTSSPQQAARDGNDCSAPRNTETAIAKDGNKAWYVYILCCGNGALYTGVTTDVRRRLREHQTNGRLAARFTRAFPPVELVYRCCVGDKKTAYQVEYRIKRLNRRQKAIVIAENFSKTKLLEHLDINQ